MLQTIYIPIRFYEREPEDIQIVRLILPEQVDENRVKARLSELHECYENGNDDPESGDGYDSLEDMADDLFSTLAEEFKGVWEYCPATEPIIIGEK